MKRDIILSIILAIISITLTIYCVVDNKNQAKKEQLLINNEKLKEKTNNTINNNSSNETTANSSVNDNNTNNSQTPANTETTTPITENPSSTVPSVEESPIKNVEEQVEIGQTPIVEEQAEIGQTPIAEEQLEEQQEEEMEPYEEEQEQIVQTPDKAKNKTATIVEATSIKLDKTNIELNTTNNKTATINATIEPSNVTDKTKTWINSNPAVATINNNGVITAKTKGTTTITVKTSNGKTASCKVTVTSPANSIRLTRMSNIDNKYITELTGDRIGQISAIINPGGSDISEVEWINSAPDKLALERVIENGTYYIKSALNEKMVLDVTGGSIDNNVAIQLYEKNNVENQQFEIRNVKGEYYTIKSKKSGKVLDVPNGSKERGTKIHQYTPNNTESQQWEFEYLGNGYYQIKSRVNGLYLDVTDAQAKNKTRIQVWTENKNKAQKFKLEPIRKRKTVVENGTYYIKAASNVKKVLDVAGGSINNKATIQMYERNETKAQQFEIINLGNNYYVIRSSKSGKVLDIPNASMELNTKLQQYSFNGTDAQIWKIEKEGEYYRFKSKRNGLYLNVIGAKTEKYAGLQMYTGNKSKSQRFKLEKISAEIQYANIEHIILKGKKKGVVSITAKLKTGKSVTNKITVKEGSWEVKNGKYIYHYTNGTKKIWSVSEYTGWKKLKEQNVKALDPTAYKITGNHIYYAGFKQYYVCKDNTANNKAIKNGGSPYAITVDLDNFRESVFENNGTNKNPIWEPIKSVRVNHGGKFDHEVWKKLDHKLFAKNWKTPQGLFYTNGAHWDNVDDQNGHILRYWVSFGTKGRINNSLKVENELYLHEVTGGKSVGYTNAGCVTAVTEHAKWIYYNIGRGTPILIW